MSNFYAYEDSKKVPALGKTKFNDCDKGYKQFSLQRPFFKSNTSVFNNHSDSISHINKRTGLGNYDMVRPGFHSAPIMARKSEFEEVEVERPEDSTVELGDKTLTKLFETKVPDIKDSAWIAAEKAERIRLTPIITRNNPGKNRSEINALIDDELRVNKPLGRDQRTTNETRNIAKSGLTIENKIKELGESVRHGRIAGHTNKTELLAQLALILQTMNTGNTDNANEFANVKTTMTMILRGLSAVAVPYKQLFSSNQKRIVGSIWLKLNKGLANFYFMSYVPGQGADIVTAGGRVANLITYDKPIFDIATENKPGSPEDGYRVDKTTYKYALTKCRNDNGKKRFIDLQRRALINPEQAKFIISSMLTRGEAKSEDEVLDDSIIDADRDIINSQDTWYKKERIISIPDTNTFEPSKGLPPNFVG